MKIFGFVLIAYIQFAVLPFVLIYALLWLFGNKRIKWHCEEALNSLTVYLWK